MLPPAARPWAGSLVTANSAITSVRTRVQPPANIPCHTWSTRHFSSIRTWASRRTTPDGFSTGPRHARVSIDRSMLRVPRGHSFRQNTVAVFGGQVLTWLLTAVTFTLVPRYLGAENMGVFALAATFSTLATAIGGMGMGTVITRDVARSREQAH